MCLDDDKPETSADQDAWVELNSKVRAKIEQMTVKVAEMSGGELKDFVSAVNQAQWTYFQAATWDKRIELEMNRHSFND